MQYSDDDLNAGILRRRAEELLKKKLKVANQDLSELEKKKLIHELEVHQIELELQNEELLITRSSAQHAAENFLDLFDSAPTGYFTISEQGKIREVNLYVANVLERDRIHLEGANFGFFVSDETKPIFNKFLENLFRSRTQQTCEIVLIAKNHASVHVHLTGSIAENRDQCLVILVDITERLRTEKALKESEARLAMAQAVAKIGSWETDLSTLDVIWSEETYRIFEADPKTFHASHPAFLEFVYPDDRTKVDTAFIESFHNDALNTIVHRIKTLGGVVKFVEERWRVFRDDYGKAIKATGTCQDITERKHAEDEIHKNNEELLRVNAEKDKFLSIIAHDLRSPFNAFLGFTRLLAENFETLSPDQIQKMALSMRNSATNLFGLLENLLEWSRLHRGMLPFLPGTYQLFPVVTEALQFVLEAASKKDIVIGIEIPEECMFFADKNMIISVLRNLAFNAVKFTPRGGKINISLTSSNEKYIELSIKDRGVGMSKKSLEALFRITEQNHKPGTEGEPSTGLGLIICRDFINKNGGQIWVESEEGIGSTFHVTIPAIPAPSH